MKKIFLKIFLIFTLIFSFNTSFAWNININFTGAWLATSKISEVSIDAQTSKTETQIENISTSIFQTLKIIIWWLLVIYLVYAWIMMIISMWDDEEKLSSSKRSVRYAIIGLIFVNIPWTLYNALYWTKTWDRSKIDDATQYWAWISYNKTLFMNWKLFWDALWLIVSFLQIAIVSLAVFVIVLSWIKIMMARWKDEVISEQKNKIWYSVLWLVFIWIMEVWRNIMFSWDFITTTTGATTWQELFSKLANLALFFAAPVAIFFLSLAWYYYITAAWEEEKTKKAKSIVINTVLATLILLGMYTFLLDLNDLKF